MRVLFLVFIFLTCVTSRAQLSATYLTLLKSKELSRISKEGSLYVVIENEKEAMDAALIDALNNFWKINEVKYISSLEFNEKLKNKTLSLNNLYLFNTFDQFAAITPYTYSHGYIVTKPGYYLTPDPNKLMNCFKQSDAPAYLFFSATELASYPKANYRGYYYLMIKNFNIEMEFCKNESNFVKKTYEKKGAYVYCKDQKSLNKKSVLLYKEQVPKQEPGKEKQSVNESVTKKFTKGSTNTYVVFPEDLEFALKKNDSNVVVYNSGNLYSAKDGSIYAARVSLNSPGKNLALFLISISLFILSLVGIASFFS